MYIFSSDSLYCFLVSVYLLTSLYPLVFFILFLFVFLLFFCCFFWFSFLLFESVTRGRGGAKGDWVVALDRDKW